MKCIAALIFALGFGTCALCASLASVRKFNGKFNWVKLGDVSGPTVKSFSKAKAFVISVSFPKSVQVVKDGRGNRWFSFVLADQGSDWKWHQTSGFAAVPISNGLIKAGKYDLKVGVAGIPAAVLADKKQTISLGPSASGLAGVISFDITGLKSN